MIGLDSNVVLRFLVQDDPRQGEAASAVFDRMSPSRPGFLSSIVLVEIFWVLSRGYRVPRKECLDLIGQLVRKPEIRVGDPDAVSEALHLAGEGSGDFADALIAALARDAGCERTVTFDAGAVGLGMELLAT